MSRRVVITGAGALSALGGTVGALWEGLLAARSGIVAPDRLRHHGLRVWWGGEVTEVDPDAPRRDEIMARRVIADALASASLPAEATAELGLSWACGLDTLHDNGNHRRAGSCFTSLAASFGRPRRMIAVACASGTQTIGEAFEAIVRGRGEAFVAGGSSIMLSPVYLTGFAALGALAVDVDEPATACRPFDAERSGFALADGAAAVVVESLERARSRGAPVLAEVLGFGTSQDAFDLSRPPPDGAGAEQSIRQALASASLRPADIDVINTHGTGTFAGDLAEAAAIERVWAREPSGPSGPSGPSVHGCKGALGHAMAAAGTLEAIVAVETIRHGLVPPTVNLTRPDPACSLDLVIGTPRQRPVRRVLSTSFGMGGQNAALILGAPP